MEDAIERPAAALAAKPSSMDLNRRLAELLGWTELEVRNGFVFGRRPGCQDEVATPDWLGDWRACGPLQAQYVRRLRTWSHRAVIGVTPSSPGEHDVVLDRGQGESADQLLRRSIVAAVIAHLEANR